MKSYLEGFIWCQWEKLLCSRKYIKPLEKAKAKDTNLVGIFKGLSGISLFLFPWNFLLDKYLYYHYYHMCGELQEVEYCKQKALRGLNFASDRQLKKSTQKSRVGQGSVWVGTVALGTHSKGRFQWAVSLVGYIVPPYCSAHSTSGCHCEHTLGR